MSPKDFCEEKNCFVLPYNPQRKDEGGLRAKGQIRNVDPNKPIVTVITVVLNRAKYLDQTIQNILNQTYNNIEYIIIDGGSTDGTLEIIKEHQARIDYWVSEPDSGIYEAMNKGWLLANERSYVLFLGAGDKLINLPVKMEELPQKSIIYGNVLLENGSVFHSNVNWMLKFSNTLHHQALMVPKLLHPRPPFNSNLRIYGDLDFNQRMLKAGVKFIRCPDFVSYACAPGASKRICFEEQIKIVYRNFGLFWAMLSFVFLLRQQQKRLVRRFIK